MKYVVLVMQAVVCNAFLSLPVLKRADLLERRTELIYIYYTRPNLSCSACEDFNQNICTLQRYVPVRRVNFFEDPMLGSRFYTFLFPSFVMRHEGRSYLLPVDSFEELEDVVRDEKWRGYRPARRYLEVDSYLTEIYAVSNFLFFTCMQKSYVVVDMVPSWVVTLVFSSVIIYMAHSIYTIFTLPVEKEKKE